MPIDPENPYSLSFNDCDFGEANDLMSSITHRVMTEIVNEEDKYTEEIIRNYVKKEMSKGNSISVNIIPEGKLRHIINLGLISYNNNIKDSDLIKQSDLFPQEQYIEYMRLQMCKLEKENQKLKNQIEIMEEQQN